MPSKEFNWSTELETKIRRLTPQQQRSIAIIVLGEIAGYPTGRMLRRSYSCRWCGKRSNSKEAKEHHEATCHRHGSSWSFAASSRACQTWLKLPEFTECLNLARQEVTIQALGEATYLLQLITPFAVRELRRQIEQGERDLDRRQAAIAILDRADLTTSTKIKEHDQLTLWLKELREA